MSSYLVYGTARQLDALNSRLQLNHDRLTSRESPRLRSVMEIAGVVAADVPADQLAQEPYGYASARPELRAMAARSHQQAPTEDAESLQADEPPAALPTSQVWSYPRLPMDEAQPEPLLIVLVVEDAGQGGSLADLAEDENSDMQVESCEQASDDDVVEPEPVEASQAQSVVEKGD